MPAFSTLTLANSAAVDYVFKPQSIKGIVATLLEKDLNAGVPSGYSAMTVSHVDPTKTNRNSKTRMKCVVPRINAVSGVVESLCSFDILFQCDDKSTEVERESIRSLAVATLVAAPGYMVVSNESYY